MNMPQRSDDEAPYSFYDDLEEFLGDRFLYEEEKEYFPIEESKPPHY